MWQRTNVALSRCHTVTWNKPKNPINAKINYVTGDCHAVTQKRPKTWKWQNCMRQRHLSHCHAVTLSPQKSPKSLKCQNYKHVKWLSCCHTALSNQKNNKLWKSQNCIFDKQQMSHCHAVTPKIPKILKMHKLLNYNMNKYLCNCDTVTLCVTALCDIFDGHLKDGRRHGMDTYLFSWLARLRLMYLLSSFRPCSSSSSRFRPQNDSLWPHVSHYVVVASNTCICR
jgi:hypothetical protein